eukprot:CAMPEP_0204129072 /NCGR_PEP_ID=MMETSP0361-20130328/12566_1 /ASSEMBLY_ACC=CAM_ASM_000343 /TAXON_ID=268821 /ORGANISM="Scrippsiella Hangoei, Strain SHTV-5" /LENGTH=241 /DNA_ID=CAMNT_0051081427 /DNA_START=42 /DNA_END=765 /DNA_ORIENTATION=+
MALSTKLPSAVATIDFRPSLSHDVALFDFVLVVVREEVPLKTSPLLGGLLRGPAALHILVVVVAAVRRRERQREVRGDLRKWAHRGVRGIVLEVAPAASGQGLLQQGRHAVEAVVGAKGSHMLSVVMAVLARLERLQLEYEARLVPVFRRDSLLDLLRTPTRLINPLPGSATGVPRGFGRQAPPAIEDLPPPAPAQSFRMALAKIRWSGKAPTSVRASSSIAATGWRVVRERADAEGGMSA